jgi:hypothetical protein
MFSGMFSDVQAKNQNEDMLASNSRTTTRTISDEVIMPPYARGKRKSKYYTRPVFKEPIAKPKVSERKSDVLHHHQKQNRSKTTQLPTIVDQLRNEALRTQWVTTDEFDVIQPSSRTRYRLKTIVGNQSEAIGSRDFKRERGLEGRLLKQPLAQSIQTDYIDSSASVATCSNLDRLEAKRLSMRQDYELERRPSDMSGIRREVTKLLVGEDVTPSPRWETSRSSDSDADSRDEQSDRSSRENGESFVSAASGGLMSMYSEAPSIQSVITDITSWTFQ